MGPSQISANGRFDKISSTNGKIIIQNGRKIEAIRLLDLQSRAYQNEAALYGNCKMVPLTQNLDDLISEYEKKTFVSACIDKTLVGSVRACLLNNTCYIERLMVEPTIQHQGVGKRLMRHIENLFDKAHRYEIYIGHRSNRTLRFFEHLGYKKFRTWVESDRLTLLYLEKNRQ